MSDVEIASLSESGQIHLPKNVREGFKAKDKFAVMRIGDNILLKRLQIPDLKKDFMILMEESRIYAKDKNISQDDIKTAIKKVRNEGSS